MPDSAASSPVHDSHVGVSQKYLISSYGIALAVIALLSIVSHLILDRELRLNRDSASVVNTSGRQRMYAEKIASLTAQYALGDTTARADLLSTIDLFSRAHTALLHGDATLLIDAGLADPTLREIYLGHTYDLDDRIDAYVAEARACAALSVGDPRIRTLAIPIFAAAKGPLLAGINAVVAVHQHESEDRLRGVARLEWIILAIVLTTLGVEALGIFQPMVRRISAYAMELRTLAATDPLTGALNRRSFNERGSIEIRKSRRYANALSVLMIDIDKFKAVNDRYGHDGGDAVLRTIAKLLAAEIRAFDLLARFGGEEFAVLLPDTDVVGAKILAERIRERVARESVPTASGSVVVTISIGVAPVEIAHATLAPALTVADRALYEAKANGRNRTVVAPTSEAMPDATASLAPVAMRTTR